MKERNEWLKNYLYSLWEELNKQYPGMILKESIENYYNKLSTTLYSKEDLIKEIDEMKQKVIERYLKKKDIPSKERKYELNDLFNCRTTDDVIHIHVVPVSIKKELSEMGVRGYLKFAEDKLLDAFSKLVGILELEENKNIKTVFAVSPLLKMGFVQELFKKYGFDVSMTKEPYFKKMFNTEKIGQAKISKEKFLQLAKERMSVLQAPEEEQDNTMKM